MKEQGYSTNPPSPLPAWQHYDVSKYAEEKVMEALANQELENVMVGLSVGYRFIPNDQPEGENYQKFSMSYGYLVDSDVERVEDEQPTERSLPDQGAQSEEPGQKGGLDENFISALYEQVKDLILQNAPPEIGEYLVSLEVTTAHCSQIVMTCQGQKCDYCSTHKKKHIFKKRKNSSNQCVWYCTGAACG